MYLHLEVSDLCLVRKKEEKNDIFCQNIISGYNDVKNLGKSYFDNFYSLK